MQTLTISRTGGRSNYTLSPTRNTGELQDKLAKCNGKSRKSAIRDTRTKGNFPKFKAGMSTADYVRLFESWGTPCKPVEWAQLNSEPCTLYSGADTCETLPDGFETWEDFDAAQSADAAPESTLAAANDDAAPTVPDPEPAAHEEDVAAPVCAPADDEPAETGAAWFERIIAENKAKRDDCEARAQKVAPLDSVPFKHSDGERFGIAGPCMSEPGRFRFSYFDSRGAIGHCTRDTLALAMWEALDLGYLYATEDTAPASPPATHSALVAEINAMSPVDAFDYLADYTTAGERHMTDAEKAPDAMRAAVLADVERTGEAVFWARRRGEPDDDGPTASPPATHSEPAPVPGKSEPETLMLSHVLGALQCIAPDGIPDAAMLAREADRIAATAERMRDAMPDYSATCATAARDLRALADSAIDHLPGKSEPDADPFDAWQAAPNDPKPTFGAYSYAKRTGRTVVAYCGGGRIQSCAKAAGMRYVHRVQGFVGTPKQAEKMRAAWLAGAMHNAERAKDGVAEPGSLRAMLESLAVPTHAPLPGDTKPEALDDDETIPAPLDGLDVAELGDEGMAEFEQATREQATAPAYRELTTAHYRPQGPCLRIPAYDARAMIPQRFAPSYLLQA